MPARCLAARSGRAGVIRGSSPLPLATAAPSAGCCACAARRPSDGAAQERDEVASFHRLLPRRPAPLIEPRAVLRHLRALRPRCIPLARRRLLALLRRAPAQLDAVVHVVGHLEIRRAVDHILDRERPGGAIGARIRELARRKLRREHAHQFRLHGRDALPLRHRVALGPPRDAIRKGAHHVHRDQQAQIARRRREIFPRAGGLEDRRAVRHGRLALPAGLELSPVFDRRHARLHLLFERRDRLLHRAHGIERRRRHHVIHPVVEVLDRRAAPDRARNRRTADASRSRRWSAGASRRFRHARSAGSA